MKKSPKKTLRCAALLGASSLALSSVLSADTISVNFHVGNDADSATPAQADHEITGSEAAGLDNNTTWNNINVGNSGNNSTAGSIFTTTVLTDDAGDASAATISQGGGDSTWFVGYGADSAGGASEIGLAGSNHDDLFNSYLALNSSTYGDGNPSDAGYISITGLGTAYTSGGYNLIIYSDSDKRAGSTGADRTSEFSIIPGGGSLITNYLVEDDIPNRITFSGTYIASDNSDTDDAYSNYTVIAGLTADSFDLYIHSDDGGRGAISGFQIVAVPEPSTTALLAGLLGLSYVMVRRRS
ncbi:MULTISPECIES: PEP-CTERM sorting domain-containing protein [unclassified Lentimonas]|uniref:PEP-CTERM sorting domain-containing protein n=1 Tax=unclassified Lentimonas TaxID=2630993 RepID=UPI001323ABF7|nr:MULTISPECIES: PEP-CTERM sorting domain-containing protein [unclassified Lentimonas]CAA6692116.1 Unannotated [Lentimonas sp. CC19]CAA6694514.1 Unannotated [Lentimonas sp. CC10]CAA7070631.1 Unannotated [Lentimonas sp. CC11]